MFTGIWKTLVQRWKPFSDELCPPVTWWESTFHCDMTEEDIEFAKKEFKWGTFGPDGKGPVKWRLLNDLETSHLENILIFMRHQEPMVNKVIIAILKERYANETKDKVVQIIKSMSKDIGDTASTLYNEVLNKIIKGRQEKEREDGTPSN